MADDVDITEQRMEFDNSITVKNVCCKAEKMLVGEPGECYFCGSFYKRIIVINYEADWVKACGKCRDTLKLDNNEN